MSDEEVCAKLVELDGIGIWTAEMLMLFSMQRRNILSFGDLALVRGMPYASVAGLYFWAVAGGAIEGMKDYAPANNKYDENRRKDKSGKK